MRRSCRPRGGRPRIQQQAHRVALHEALLPIPVGELVSVRERPVVATHPPELLRLECVVLLRVQPWPAHADEHGVHEHTQIMELVTETFQQVNEAWQKVVAEEDD